MIVKISEDDTKKIAEAVKLSILSDIQHMIDLKTQALIEKINVLEKVNGQLTNDLDNLEQYDNRSLIRIIFRYFNCLTYRRLDNII
jgi:hypothetical protein